MYTDCGFGFSLWGLLCYIPFVVGFVNDFVFRDRKCVCCLLFVRSFILLFSIQCDDVWGN